MIENETAQSNILECSKICSRNYNFCFFLRNTNVISIIYVMIFIICYDTPILGLKLLLVSSRITSSVVLKKKYFDNEYLILFILSTKTVTECVEKTKEYLVIPSESKIMF